MNHEMKPVGKSVLGVGALAALACAACCIGPILAFLGGLGTASALGALWVPALAAVTLLALSGMAWVLHRRRRAAVCSTGQGPVDLGCPPRRPASPPGTPCHDDCAPGGQGIGPLKQGVIEAPATSPANPRG
ncbi:hypothetical protein [Streptomyces pilosus]|uniref:hypothetical protein n=1 Tax=Streptomyces pilosus TaxID=28893 RepID=UPI00364075A6